jgi:DNA-binding MarR family transcriptional regulator
MPTSVSAGLLSRAALLLYRMGSMVGDLADPHMSDLGLTGRQYAALAVLDDDQPRSQQELGQLMRLGGQVVVGLIDELEGRGLVQRRRSAEDRRRSVVVLTATGRDLLAQADGLESKLEAAMFSSLTAEEREQFKATLRRIMQTPWGPPDPD